MTIQSDTISHLCQGFVDRFARMLGGDRREVLDELTTSCLTYVIYKRGYYEAGEAQTFETICQEARHQAKDLLTGVDMATVPMPALWDFSVRPKCLMYCFVSPEIVNACIRILGGEVFLFSFAYTLKVDAVFAQATRLELRTAIETLDRYERIGEDAHEELIRRWKAKPKEVVETLGIAADPDPTRRNEHYKATLNHFKKITRKYHLPADHGDDEKEFVLVHLIGKEIGPLQEGLHSQFEWIQKKENYLIANIIQGLQQIIREQYAQQRHPDVIANRVYIDAETEDGQNVGERLAADYPDTLTNQTADPTPELSQQQLSIAKTAFGKTGARVLVDLLNNPDATQAELAKKLGVSLSTVERHIRQFRKKGKKFWKCDFL